MPLLRLLNESVGMLQRVPDIAASLQVETEAELLSAAASLALCGMSQVGDGTGDNSMSSRLNGLRAAIRDGGDPLGDELIRLRTPESRRGQGAVYTPLDIVRAMVAWAEASPAAPPARVVDPGSGSGRFLMQAALSFPDAQLVAAETDPLAIALLRANAAVLGCGDRLSVHADDYRFLRLRRIDSPTLFIGNPPYIRHHDLGATAKTWFSETAKRFDIRASKLAGSHIHFFLKTRELGRPGDYGIFITSSEWLDVNYGATLRRLLADGLGGTELHILDPSLRPFEGAMTTAAITCFHMGQRSTNLSIRAVPSMEALRPLSGGKLVSWTVAENTTRWSTLLRTLPEPPADSVELGEVFRVHRGQVTGSNEIWIAGSHASALPGRFLVPTLTRARELLSAGDSLEDTDQLRRVVDIPVDLSALSDTEFENVDQFLKWARRYGADKTYVARHRRAWWSVGLREPAPILCTYMARRAPAFVRNKAMARHLNIAHGLYPRGPLAEIELEAILEYLRGAVRVDQGRTYAGGLVKFEPGEVSRIRIPASILRAAPVLP